MPILKLRYQQTPNQAVQGTDVPAFRFRQTPPVIAVPEVKTRATRKRALGTEAHDSLEKVLVRLDESLHVALFRCAERDHQFLVRHLAALLRRPEERVVERHMVFVHEALVRKDDVVALLADVVTRRTKLTVVKISGLQDFVARVHRAAETGAGSSRTETDKGTAALRPFPAMIKYGVGSPAACYASSIGIRDRATANNLAANCPTRSRPSDSSSTGSASSPPTRSPRSPTRTPPASSSAAPNVEAPAPPRPRF
ncbi:hypothetical protein [Streptomyces sp. NPDC059134]|uniref:hypothetical protein n=1 Tax=Streptomyces sp. NPDC059134 TaxID=3346738 RepID=UPI003694EEDA